MKAKLISVVMFSALLLACASRAQESVTGIGIVLSVENSTLKIMKVLPNTPASRAGLSPGLRLQKIDGTVTDGKHLKEYVDMLRGPAGMTVRLELVDAARNKTNTLDLIRERILIEPNRGPAR